MSFLSGASQIKTPTAFQPAGFTSSGFTGSYAGGSYNVAPTAGLSSTVGQLQSTFGQAATAFKGLGATVAPGFSTFRKAGLADLTTQQQASRSNLQDTLAQRRILGSSFANAQQSQQDAEFAAKRDQFIAQSYLAELEASNKLIQEQFQAKTQQFAVGINEMNLEAGIAADLSAKATSSMASIAQAQAELDAKAQAGVGSFFGTLASGGLGAFGKYAGSSSGSSALTSLFGGAGGASSAGGTAAAATGGEALLSDAEMEATLAALA